MKNLIQLRHINKSFGSIQANKDINFSCRAGEIVCLLGENGAGKSTLMKILYGQYKADSGTIIHKGKEIQMESPQVAISLGIQMVHQHFMLVPSLTVTDNIMLGHEIRRGCLYDRQQAAQAVRHLSDAYGLHVEPNQLVSRLSVGEQQRVEIVKALYQGADLLILDEPTAVLTPQEVEDLFRIIHQLKTEGKTVILITHKLKETMAISDRVYVLRNGSIAGERQTNETSIDELSRLMVGHAVEKPVCNEYRPGKPLLNLHQVSLKPAKKKALLDQINLTIHQHEILGIAGVEGNGQMELIQVITGMNTGWTGEIYYNEQPIQGRDTSWLLNEGIACIHADRQKHSIAMSLNVDYNFALGSWQSPDIQRHGLLRWPHIQRQARQLLEDFDVRPRDTSRTLSEFSGGNQQKFVVGREVSLSPEILIAAHPTRGVDIMATAFIHQHLLDLRAKDKAVLLISSDLDELLELSDTIAVIYGGSIVSCRPASSYHLMELGRLMGGGQPLEV